MNIQEFLLKSLPEEKRSKYEKLAQKQIYKRGDMVFRAGDKATRVFLLTKGAVKFIAPARKDGKETFLNLSRNSGIFGLWAALHSEDRIADAIVLDDTEILAYEKNDFLEMVSCCPKIAELMIDHLAQTIREMEVWNLNLRSMDAKARLSEHLLNRHKKEKGQTFKVLRLKELASYLNMEPETISRLLASFVKNKYIQKNHRMITVLDEEALKKEMG